MVTERKHLGTEPTADIYDIEAFITSKPPGSATFSKFKFFDHEDRTAGWEVAFMIREESKRIRHLGKDAGVEIRAALIQLNQVGLIPILIAPESHRANIFETWLNFHAPRLDGNKNDCLETLCKQDSIPILFYSKSGRERSIRITNHVKPIWNIILEQVSRMGAWETKGFDLARGILESQFPTVRSLWNSLNLQNENDAKWPGRVCVRMLP